MKKRMNFIESAAAYELHIHISLLFYLVRLFPVKSYPAKGRQLRKPSMAYLMVMITLLGFTCMFIVTYVISNICHFGCQYFILISSAGDNCNLLYLVI